MVKTKIKSALLTSIALAVVACTGTIPDISTPGYRESFPELDKEYTFSSKDLARSYLERKLLTWLGPPEKGPQLVKEIAFARFKYESLFRDLMLGNQDLLARINAVQEVKDRRNIDPAFASFLDSCIPASPPAFIGEFQVNTYTDGDQVYSSVAIDSDGDFVVAWEGNNNQDGQSYGISARRYHSDGTPNGPEFIVNTTTEGLQRLPAAAMDSNGDFVITWMSYFQDNDRGGIYAQRYDSTGLPVGSEFLVNTTTAGNQSYPAVAMDGAGDFVVTWHSQQDGVFQDNYLGYTLSYGIYAQRYHSNGTLNGSEIQVNTFTTGNQNTPAVAMDSAGDFVIAWNSYGQDGEAYGVYARKYGSNGVSSGSEFQVNTYTTGFELSPSVAMDAGGDFVIAWCSFGQDGDYFGIFAQRYNNAAEPQGTEFQVNTFTTTAQSNPAVAMDSGGDFVITWQSRYQDNSSYGVFGQRYSVSGLPAGSEFQVNTFSTSNQSEPNVVMDSTGNFVVIWQSAGQESNDFGIFGQKFNSNGVPL
jgi:hypothetical protein